MLKRKKQIKTSKNSNAGGEVITEFAVWKQLEIGILLFFKLLGTHVYFSFKCLKNI